MAALHQDGIKSQQATCGSASAWSEASRGLDAHCSLMCAYCGALCCMPAGTMLRMTMCRACEGLQDDPAHTCRLRNRSYTCSSVWNSVATSELSRMSHSLKIAACLPKMPRLTCTGDSQTGVTHCRDSCSSEPSAEQDRSLEGPDDKLHSSSAGDKKDASRVSSEPENGSPQPSCL